MTFKLSKPLLRSTLILTSKTTLIPSLTILKHTKRNFAEEVRPYRPFPLEDYFYPTSAKYFLENNPVKQNDQEEYQNEEIYLDELENRMNLYDKKYSMTDDMKKVWNEFGIENVDDKAFTTYGKALGSDEQSIKQFGRGKKINPAQYMNPGYSHVKRNPLSTSILFSLSHLTI